MSFRNYQDTRSEVYKHYYNLRSYQTLEYVLKMKDKHNQYGHPLTWEKVLEILEQVVDQSDPDLVCPNLYHGYQTAETIRQAGHPEWLQVTGLIHDAGKILALWGSDEDGTSLIEQWGLVGDTFITGCQIPKTVVYPELNRLNPDQTHPKYKTYYGIYNSHCGLDQTHISWGHDEYLYRVLKNNHHLLPDEALYIIRYHSLYPWHQAGSYSHLENDYDKKMKKWVQLFNQFDLYSKDGEHPPDIPKLKQYYADLLKKFFPIPVLNW